MMDSKNNSDDSCKDPLLPSRAQLLSNARANTTTISSKRGVSLHAARAERKASRRDLQTREGGSTPVLDQLFTVQSRDLSSFVKETPSERLRPKSLLFTLLNPRSRQWQAIWFKSFISTVILVDLIIFVLSTEPNLSDEQKTLCHTWEGVTSTIFLIEYLARIYAVIEAKKYGEFGPFWGRVHFVTNMASIVDALAILPFFLELVTGWNLPTLTFLRAFRLLRILKTNGMVRATDAVYRVIYYNRQILYVALFVCIFMILVTSVLMYYLRPRNHQNSQEFQSILSTMYLSTLMLTGQGGPQGDLPWYTKSGVLLTGAFSIGMFAIPASMLTWGFEAEAARIAKRSRQQSKKKLTASNNSDWSSSDDDYSTDEEYQKIIAGEESDGTDDDEETRAAKAKFLEFDVDGSGSISVKEYLKLVKQERLQPPITTNGDDLAKRMANLETKVDDVMAKLDKMCTMMEAKKK